MRVVETCCCGARFETQSGTGAVAFRAAHEPCRLAWCDRKRAEAADDKPPNDGPGEITTSPVGFGSVADDLPTEHRRGW